jgi:hypothetical protein
MRTCPGQWLILPCQWVDAHEDRVPSLEVRRAQTDSTAFRQKTGFRGIPRDVIAKLPSRRGVPCRAEKEELPAPLWRGKRDDQLSLLAVVAQEAVRQQRRHDAMPPVGGCQGRWANGSRRAAPPDRVCHEA